MEYNFKHFHIDLFDLTRFAGPRAGEQATDFTLYNLDGQAVTLADFKGKWLVLETGSGTCPMYARNVAPMTELVAAYPDVEFIMVYVRESHPGGRINAHKDLAAKIAIANTLPDAINERRRILVDTPDGAMHRVYGEMPNSIYVINPEGVVIYRCDWNYMDGISAALAERDRLHENEHAPTEVLKPSPGLSIKMLMRGGWSALLDFIKMVPRLQDPHIEADEYFAAHGRMKQD